MFFCNIMLYYITGIDSPYAVDYLVAWVIECYILQTLHLTGIVGASFDVDVNQAQNVAVYPMTGEGALPGDFIVLDYGMVGVA